MNYIDNLLNKITMYRLALWELTGLLLAAGALGFIGMLPYSPEYLAYSVAIILIASYLTNWVFARVFEAPSNTESTYITALILALIISPPHDFLNTAYLKLALAASGWAVASKYIFAINKKHLFNPAALGVAIPGIFIGLGASWWVGTPAMLPFVLVGGLLVVRKIRRFDLFFSFLAAATVSVTYFALSKGTPLMSALPNLFIYAPVIFFATVMLTEPLTSPGARMPRMLYGALVGLLFAPDVHVGGLYSTPELALLCGNFFSYLISPKRKLLLTLKEKTRLTRDTYEFAFAAAEPFSFKPGQYMEWTLPHERADSRGMRRYFTLASAPSERLLRLGVKFYSPASSFKKGLAALREGDTVVASQLAGDFTLPRNTSKKLVFIAGGIGITPFRSMLQHLIDTGEKRLITVFYSMRSPEDAAYAEVLEEARQKLGISVVYAITDEKEPLKGDARTIRAITPEAIRKRVPDYTEAAFYISGPQGMVASFRDMLQDMGVPRRNIKKDFFPGFA